MTDSHDTLPVPADRPIDDPGLPEHAWRPTDVDPAAEKRAERQVAGLFGLSMVCAVLFVVAYFSLDIGDNHTTFLGMGASTLALGAALGGTLLFFGIGIIQWARKLMGDHEIIEMRHPARSSDEDRAATLEALNLGLEESGIGRRKLVLFGIGGAGFFMLAPAVVLLRDLGPTPNQVAESGVEGAGLERTIWTKGMRVVRDVVGTPIRPADVEIGDLFNAEPAAIFEVDEEGHPLIEGVELQVAKSKGAVVLIRMDPEDNNPGPGRENWDVDGILCYSKICTHVGCPISLNERKTHHLLCPCHQSTFDLADAAKVVFGPAARPLPQLPLAVDEEGYLVAQSDFTEPVGPSYWERDSQADTSKIPGEGDSA
ncbi:ubiquinol-cytochrome c reductase iron-sulfur subunit [Nocardioides sp. SYSU D00038]|uniref:cytochrome bc1 complex Rieske iron-sulfur subunit n=1 Tax=Nocardioides sp. SYSU D00038 TaxID=2812554 RepID=UPI00196889FD|nr:Rieske 2Fe-2S domain-containing protein [Nocardioides sp. SYSU D00038]